MRLTTAILALTLMAAQASANEAATASINKIRAARGLTPVSYSEVLEKTALGHAKDMYSKGFFSHKGSNGSTIGKRARRAGYKFCIIAENIAKGQKSLEIAMNGWRDSPSHYANMTLKQVREYAVVQQGDVWVMVLGARKC